MLASCIRRSASAAGCELVLAERGTVVASETVQRRCQKFGESFAKRLRRRRPPPRDKWHLDEGFMRVDDQTGPGLKRVAVDLGRRPAAVRGTRRPTQWSSTAPRKMT
jgi:transposase-like protein